MKANGAVLFCGLVLTGIAALAGCQNTQNQAVSPPASNLGPTDETALLLSQVSGENLLFLTDALQLSSDGTLNLLIHSNIRYFPKLAAGANPSGTPEADAACQIRIQGKASLLNSNDTVALGGQNLPVTDLNVSITFIQVIPAATSSAPTGTPSPSASSSPDVCHLYAQALGSEMSLDFTVSGYSASDVEVLQFDNSLSIKAGSTDVLAQGSSYLFLSGTPDSLGLTPARARFVSQGGHVDVTSQTLAEIAGHYATQSQAPLSLNLSVDPTQKQLNLSSPCGFDYAVEISAIDSQAGALLLTGAMTKTATQPMGSPSPAPSSGGQPDPSLCKNLDALMTAAPTTGIQLSYSIGSCAGAPCGASELKIAPFQDPTLGNGTPASLIYDFISQ